MPRNPDLLYRRKYANRFEMEWMRRIVSADLSLPAHTMKEQTACQRQENSS